MTINQTILVTSIIIFFQIILPVFIVYGIIYVIKYNNSYGYKDKEKITKKNTQYYRDIPCNGDIFLASTLIDINNFNNSKPNILGAILLKWIKEDKLSFSKDDKTSLLLKNDVLFEDELEKELYDMLYLASSDGILEKNELKLWLKNNRSKFSALFKKIKNREINKLRKNGFITTAKTLKECKAKNVLNNEIYLESKKLYGLKLFLENFSAIEQKETLQVHLFEDYLIFAYLFGIADKVEKEFEKIYPDIVNQLTDEFNYLIKLNKNLIWAFSILGVNPFFIIFFWIFKKDE